MSDVENSEIGECIQYLCDRSFLIRDVPHQHSRNRVKLTPKGLNHYKQGASFEQNYINKSLALKNDSRSRWAFRIAVLALVVSILKIFVI